MEQIEQLTDEQLRSELLAFNANIGPVTDTTRKVYRLKLHNYVSSRESNGSSDQPSSTDSLLTDERHDSAHSSDHQSFQSHDFPTSRPSAYYNDYGTTQNQNRLDLNSSGVVLPPVATFSRNEPRVADVFAVSGAPSSAVIDAGGDVGFERSLQPAGKAYPSKKVADMRTSSQNDSPMSPNMTSTPHYGTNNASPARNSVGTTPITSGAAAVHGGNYTQTKLFGDVPTNYPQLRQRVQPSAGNTPAMMTSATGLKSSLKPVVRNTAAPSSYTDQNPSSVSRSSNSPMFYVKCAVYCFLCFVMLLAFLVWLNMEPAVSV